GCGGLISIGFRGTGTDAHAAHERPPCPASTRLHGIAALMAFARCLRWMAAEVAISVWLLAPRPALAQSVTGKLLISPTLIASGVSVRTAQGSLVRERRPDGEPRVGIPETEGSGFYLSFADLPPGSYTLRLKVPGYAPVVVTSVPIEARAVFRLEVPVSAREGEEEQRLRYRRPRWPQPHSCNHFPLHLSRRQIRKIKRRCSIEACFR
ncbi:MAG: carboxypeptidase-like regulatory domain-containing protein, partial [Myxococcota bacterium]